MTKRKSFKGRKVRQVKAQRGIDWKIYALIAGTVLLIVVGIVVLREVRTPQATDQVSLDKSKGADEAPVVVVEYGDFQ